METLKTTFENKLQGRIEDHLKNHYILGVNCSQLIKEDKKCAHCGKNLKRFSFVFTCEEITEEGCTHTRFFCTESEHDAYVTSGRPFEYDVAIEIAEELGGKAGILAFANWLFDEIKVNSKIDIAPYIRAGSDDVELGELPETLADWEKQFVEEQFEFYTQEMYNRLYESMLPKN